ncbi:hypothetical protein [Escherichia coli]|nr:hypothetical protein [Escherichia coli]MCP8723655.1 hypothetical protein [Escherichia coli]MCP8779808.1 hypothetical protein [Escherichia coli]MCX0139951.1 hypothetical protein [Escherichia coli]MCX0226051.1 hypothetical protein [Escherichia coli]MDD8555253.1 hypothetical protein [Escherichia coli]
MNKLESLPTLSIPVISDCVAMAIESRFKYMMLLF